MTFLPRFDDGLERGCVHLLLPAGLQPLVLDSGVRQRASGGVYLIISETSFSLSELCISPKLQHLITFRIKQANEQ